MREEGPIASSTDDSINPEDMNEKEKESPTTSEESAPVEHEQECWNSSRTNIYRYIQVLLAFTILGMHDGSIGALIPYVSSCFTLKCQH